jgi:hypothetical protein
LELYRGMLWLYDAVISGLRGNSVTDPSLRSPRVKPCGFTRHEVMWHQDSRVSTGMLSICDVVFMVDIEYMSFKNKEQK